MKGNNQPSNWVSYCFTGLQRAPIGSFCCAFHGQTAVSGDAYVVLLVDTPGAEQHASKAIDVLLL
jgi:hypothetical protein